MAFTVHAVMPGVWHIVDCMGVCMTLLEGENAAMLVDTGYGIEDVADFMRHMTDLPLTVFLTHNHHATRWGHAASRKRTCWKRTWRTGACSRTTRCGVGC